MKIVSSILTILITLHNHSTIIVEAKDWEYQEEMVNLDGTGCPCFSITDGLQFANTKLAGSTVDFHRRSSCHVEEPQITINYAYLHEYNVNPLFGGFSLPIDGVVYHHVSATYDTLNKRYQCSKQDTVRTITAKEALFCHNLLKSTCQTMEQRMCPCYGMSDLAEAEQRIVDGTTVIDTSKSCVMPTERNDQYGVFEIGNYDSMGRPCDGCTTIMFAVQNENMCFDGSDIVRTINLSQKNHCFAMMQNMCSSMENQFENVSSPDVSAVVPACRDDAEFRADGNERRTCEWVSRDSKKRCKRYDNNTGKRVFEFCRMTCETCTCQDDDNFRFNGNPVMDCDWVAQDVEARCALDESIRKNCIVTCSSDCCRDNEKFGYWGFPSLNCEWLSARGGSGTMRGSNGGGLTERNILCGLRAFAANCPETCGMCPATTNSDA